MKHKEPRLNVKTVQGLVYGLTAVNVGVVAYRALNGMYVDIGLYVMAIYFCVASVLLFMAVRRLRLDYSDSKTASVFVWVSFAHLPGLIVLMVLNGVLSNSLITQDATHGILILNLFGCMLATLMFYLSAEAYFLVINRRLSTEAKEDFDRKFAGRTIDAEWVFFVDKVNDLTVQLSKKKVSIVDGSVLVIQKSPLVVVDKQIIESIHIQWPRFFYPPWVFFKKPYLAINLKDGRRFRLAFAEIPNFSYTGDGGGSYWKRYGSRLRTVETQFNTLLDLK